MLIARPAFGNYYNDGLAGTGGLRGARTRCACNGQQAMGFDLMGSITKYGGQAFDLIQQAGAGKQAMEIETLKTQQAEAAAKAAAADAAKRTVSGGPAMSTNTMMIVGAGAVGLIALVMLTRK